MAIISFKILLTDAPPEKLFIAFFQLLSPSNILAFLTVATLFTDVLIKAFWEFMVVSDVKFKEFPRILRQT